ncbi:hypothetical protein [Sorangium cellulosum]|nr:hypothetical protein [Sorangium cellulosum]
MAAPYGRALAVQHQESDAPRRPEELLLQQQSLLIGCCWFSNT